MCRSTIFDKIPSRSLMKSSQIMEQPMAGRASMAVLGYRLYSYEVFTKAISKQNRALNGKDSSQIELCDWVRFFILQTSLIRSCLITLPSRTYPPFIALYGRFQVDRGCCCCFVIGAVLFTHSQIKWVLSKFRAPLFSCVQLACSLAWLVLFYYYHYYRYHHHHYHYYYFQGFPDK